MRPYETITLAVEDGVAVITLDRPQARNALDDRMRVELPEALQSVAADDAVGAVILTGAGSHFCSGGDLRAMTAERTAFQSRERMRVLNQFTAALVNLEKPVIAAVDGVAFGGGFSMALAADFVLATPAATFCAVFARVGLVPDMGSMYLLPRAVGLQRAKEIMFSARVIGAEEARALGLVLALHPADELLAAAKAMARQLCGASPQAMALMKTILNQSSESNFQTLCELESSAQGLCMDSAYHKEAVRRFLAREPLQFQSGAPPKAGGKSS